MKNNVKNQDVAVTSKYIIVKVDWDHKLVFTLEEGLEFMRLWGDADNMDSSGTFKKSDKTFEVSFITEEQIKGLENRQKHPMLHDFTCMGHNGCIRKENNNGTLIPTTDKWVCPCGKYTQEYDENLIDVKK